MKKLMVLAILGFVSLAKAETTMMTVASHSLSGSYERTLGELIAVCSDEKFTINQAKGVTNGGVGNLEALANNKAQAALVRSDVLTAFILSDISYKRFQTLVTLYPEPLHILVLRDSKSKKKGSWTGAKVNFNTLSEMNEYVVGGGGGTVYTLKILKGQGGAGFNIMPFDDSKSMMAALDAGEIDAAAFVGAAPLPNLQALDKRKYRLISIGDAIVDKVKGIYRTTSVNYDGLSDGPTHTIASNLVILTRRYNTAQKIDAQRHLRECFNRNLTNLQDNASPQWQSVVPNDRGVLDWYEIPATK